jgi:ABC-type oligopeptide transport system ATPase subunit
MNDAEPLLEVSDLVKHFPITSGVLFRRQVGAVHAVDGLSFTVHRGESFGLVGESGCGKSTTARLIAKLLKPTGGTVRFDGEDVTQARGAQLRRLRREVAMIFQDPYSSLNPRRTVGSILAEPFEIHGLHGDRGGRKRAVQELMERVGLNPEQFNRHPHQFSGGQRQRLGIARALTLDPKLIIADEPVSAPHRRVALRSARARSVHGSAQTGAAARRRSVTDGSATRLPIPPTVPEGAREVRGG